MALISSTSLSDSIVGQPRRTCRAPVTTNMSGSVAFLPCVIFPNKEPWLGRAVSAGPNKVLLDLTRVGVDAVNYRHFQGLWSHPLQYLSWRKQGNCLRRSPLTGCFRLLQCQLLLRRRSILPQPSPSLWALVASSYLSWAVLSIMSWGFSAVFAAFHSRGLFNLILEFFWFWRLPKTELS